MRIPRVSIFGLMVLVGLFAANATIIRGLFGLRTSHPGTILALAVLMPLNLLGIGLVHMVVRLARAGECTPFAVGFQVAGWPATVAVAAASLVENGRFLREYLIDYVQPFSFLLVKASGAMRWSQIEPRVVVMFLLGSAIFVVAVNGPMVMAALLGGYLFRWSGVTLVRRPPEAGPGSSLVGGSPSDRP